MADCQTGILVDCQAKDFGCHCWLAQQCQDVTWNPTRRFNVDGPLADLAYTYSGEGLAVLSRNFIQAWAPQATATLIGTYWGAGQTMGFTNSNMAADDTRAGRSELSPLGNSLVPRLLFTCILQWPLALMLSKGTFSRTDSIALFLLIAALVCTFAPGSFRRLGAVCVAVAAIFGSLGAFVAMRQAPIVLTFAIIFLIWGLTALSTFRLNHRLIAGLSVFIATMITAFSLTEIVWILNKKGWHTERLSRVIETREGRMHIRGLKAYKSLLPSSTATHKLEWREGGTIFDVQYTVDSDGTRTVPNRPAEGPRWSLFGASFTFGIGLPNDQTIAAKLQRLHPEVRVYNHGVSWSGSADVYFHMKQQYESPDPPDRSFYLFIEDHLFRTASPDWFVFEVRQQDRPCFELLPDLTFVGTAAKRQAKYGVLGQLHCNLLERSILYRGTAQKTYRLTAYDVRRVVALVTAMRDMAFRGGSDRFLFVILPESQHAPHRPDLLAQLLKELHAADVNVLDCREMLMQQWEQSENSQKDYLFPYDGHPTEKYTRFVADAISDYLADPQRAVNSPLSTEGSNQRGN